MNVKNKMKYTVAALSLCLLTAAAQANVFKDAKKGFTAVGRVFTGAAQERGAKGITKATKSGVKVTIVPGEQAAGKLSIPDRIVQALEKTKEGLERRRWQRKLRRLTAEMSHDELMETLSTPYVVTGQDGTRLITAGSFRELYLPADPAPLPNGLRWQDTVRKFDGVRSYQFLSSTLSRAESLRSSSHSMDFVEIVTEAYGAMAQGKINEWRLDEAIKAPIEDFLSKKQINPAEDPAFFEAERETAVPEWRNTSWIISFTEFQVQNGGNFPTLGLDPDLDVMIMGLWNKMLEPELDQSALLFLLDDYLYASDAQDITEVLNEARAFFDAHHRFWPGVLFFCKDGNEARAFMERMKAGELTTEEIAEVSLGQKLVLLVKGLQVNGDYWSNLSEDLQEMILDIDEDIDEELLIDLVRPK